MAGSVIDGRFDRLELLFTKCMKRQSDLQSELQSHVDAFQVEIWNRLEQLEVSQTLLVGQDLNPDFGDAEVAIHPIAAASHS